MVADPDVGRLMQLCQVRLRLDPRDPDALFAKAAILGQMKLYDHALRCLRGVSSQDSRYPGLELFRSRILSEMGRARLLQTSLEDGQGWEGALEI